MKALDTSHSVSHNLSLKLHYRAQTISKFPIESITLPQDSVTIDNGSEHSIYKDRENMACSTILLENNKVKLQDKSPSSKRMPRSSDNTTVTANLLDDNSIGGDKRAIQTFATSCRFENMMSRYWNSSNDYRSPSSPQLTITLNDIRAQERGPYYTSRPTPTICTNSEISADPDIIAHEYGHAVLDGYGHYDCSNAETACAHEAFADVASMMLSLQSKITRDDVQNIWESGGFSTSASIIGEGAPAWMRSRQDIPGMRDISTLPPPSNRDYTTPHNKSKIFSHGFYRALYEGYRRERLECKEASPELMENICSHFTQAFVNLMAHLPSKLDISLEDMVEALIESERNIGTDKLYISRDFFELQANCNPNE